MVQPALRDEPGRCEGFGEDQVRCKISRHWSLLSGWVSDWLVQPSMQDEVGRSSGSGGPSLRAMERKRSAEKSDEDKRSRAMCEAEHLGEFFGRTGSPMSDGWHESVK